MKNLFYICLLPLTLLASPPSWYVQNSLPAKEYEIVGYGVGDTKEEAKRIAKSDIANSIQTSIKSDVVMKESEVNGEYKKSTIIDIKESSNVTLSDLSLVESLYADGKYFVALKYVNLPFAKKVYLKLHDVKNIQKETNSYLVKTPLLQELKNEFGFFPKIQIDKNNLIIKNQSFTINNETLKKLFASVSNDNIKIIQAKSVKQNEFYFIKLVAKKSGYVTLVQFYENGEISILFSNKKLSKNSKITYPNQELYDGLQAYMKKGVDKTKDLTITILCDNKKDFSYFDYISEHKESFAKVYGKLFDSMDGCDVSSKMLHVKR